MTSQVFVNARKHSCIELCSLYGRKVETFMRSVWVYLFLCGGICVYLDKAPSFTLYFFCCLLTYLSAYLNGRSFIPIHNGLLVSISSRRSSILIGNHLEWKYQFNKISRCQLYCQNRKKKSKLHFFMHDLLVKPEELYLVKESTRFSLLVLSSQHKKVTYDL